MAEYVAPKIKYIYQLPYKEERELCTILDLNDRWEELGGKYMKFSVLELSDIRRVEKHGESPTRRLLQFWGQRNNTIWKMYFLLYQMQHYQAMTVLEPFVPEEYHVLEQDTEVTRALKNLEHNSVAPRQLQPMPSSSMIMSGQNTATASNRSMHSGTNETRPHTEVDPNVTTNHNLDQPTPLATDRSINKVPKILLDPSKSHRGALHPKGCHNVQSSLRPSVPSDFGAKIINKMSPSGNTVLSSAKSCEENNCSDCTKRHQTSKPQFAREYREQILERYPSLRPSTVSGTLVVEANHGIDIQSTSREPTGVKQRHPSIPSPDNTTPNNGNIPSRRGQSSPSDVSISSDSSVPMISYRELELATEAFNEKNLLGKGGFGSVYKGTWKLSKVAIKKINMDSETVLGAMPIQIAQTLDELKYLQSFRHKNILQVFGFSADEGKPPCLVYELMENGSLEERLQCRKRSTGNQNAFSRTEPLSWNVRLKIAHGTAAALQYLHTVKSKPIIHGDVKSANILLEKDFEPKLGDFGLAREGPQSHYTSVKVARVNGTRAYIPSEYLRDRKLSTKVDTYSFGIVLFEICTGLRAYEAKRKPQLLKDFVEEEDDILSLIDCKAGVEGCEIFKDFVEMGKKCTNDKHTKRPDMITVYKELDERRNILTLKEEQTRRIASEPGALEIPYGSLIISSGYPYPSLPTAGPSQLHPSYIPPYQLMSQVPHPQLSPQHYRMLHPSVNYLSPPKVPLRSGGQSSPKIQPSTSPSVITEESSEAPGIMIPKSVFNDSTQSISSSSESESAFLPNLTGIGKKSSFLD